MMALDVVTSASTVPASEALSQIVEAILEVMIASNNVLIKKESFKELAAYLEGLSHHSEGLNSAIEILNREIKGAKELTTECSKRNKVYLLMNCRAIISQALGILPLASLDLSTDIIEEIEKVCDNMQRAEFRAAIAEEEILEKVESGIQERNVDRSYANHLLSLIADAVGISTERSALKKEFDEFKSEIENSRMRKDQAEAVQMDQIIALLERADAASSPREKEMKYFSKRKSLGSQPLEPLQSFYCPITRDVMVDPVETSSGQTFERSAIEKWFSDGNNLCPLTMTVLDTSILRPNKTLRQSIEEWKDRNTMITIASMKPKLVSTEVEEVLHCLEQLQDLCQQRDQHREWERLANGDDAVESIVRSLGRRIEERKLAVALLLELSTCNTLRDQIGDVQGCILLLVTMASSDDNQASRDAQELLENLSFSDDNVVQMAKANYFKHLLQRLSAGPESVKMRMATTLAEMELTDHHKHLCLKEMYWVHFFTWFLRGDIQMKKSGVKALRNLSKGAVGPLVDLLLHHSSSSSSLREETATAIMHLAVSTMYQESSQTPVTLLESDKEIFMLFSLINLTGPNVQQRILQTFNALCRSPSAGKYQDHINTVLVQLCEHDNENVRANAVKLFCCLVDDGDEAIIREHVGQKCLETLVTIIQSSHNEEEIASAMGILSKLPEVPQFTQWLLDAGALPIVLNFLKNGRQNDPNRFQVVENAVGALRRFTAPTNLEWQKRAAEAGVIPKLVQLLEYGTTLTKEHAATRPIPKRKGFWCFSPPPEIGCQVHGGLCGIESSFCLLEANAVRPLVRVLEDPDHGACEASLDALVTLIEGERLQNGSKVLEDAISPSPKLQEKALDSVERIFRLPEFKQKYGKSAQMPLVDLTQRGNSSMKSLSARVLAHLNVLQDQSSYF
ncbi:RING-type E3 ubiquitin transferase [Citrus sinensis]|uniref:RING-type E3 ubiquitin transferase n=1 Tax=Citrus sinensis TaxID=2711 RepID=A0ACB8MP00_CITSI|nr:RING-type E3 ubiquitin transferase [Citrus sinensis]